MDKNAIKKYAVWARRELISRVSQKALQYGISEKEIVSANAASVGGVVLSAEEVKQRQALIERIHAKGYEQTIEEVAYTWFNRFIALRFMEVNGYLPSRVRIFTDENNQFNPQILTEAISLEMDGLDMEKVYAFKDANDNDGLFKYLVIVQCNALSPILPKMFQRISDYTELLFPDNLLREGSAIEQMITMIPEEDWKDAVQIIGWLYQYYNSEKKDEVFAALKKNIKITKENIPAATQLFTPDWIVRYMVENSLGRLWMEHNAGCAVNDYDERPGDLNEHLVSRWKYYVFDAEQKPEVQEQLVAIRKGYAAMRPEDIKCIDPCCGSGHILAYLFDVLVQIYESCGYATREAVASIIRNNLYGLDIDERAAQLSYFAVMMKARQYDRRFLSRKNADGEPDVPQPHVYAIQESNHIDPHAVDYFVGDDRKREKDFGTLVEELRDAKEYGSILNITPVDFAALYARIDEVFDDFSIYRDMVFSEILPLIQVAEALAQKYDVVVTNPPYMGSSGMSVKLSEFVKKNYPDSKGDLFACFIEHGNLMVKHNGYNCMVTMQSWMFLSSFEKMRVKILQTHDIAALMHMENMVMGIAFGTAVAVFRNSHISGYKGTYHHIKLENIENDKPKVFPVLGNRFAQVSTDSFSKIPGAPVAYWWGNFNVFDLETISNYYESAGRNKTHNNELYVRSWWEIKDTVRWQPYANGGVFRRWAGNDLDVVDWSDTARAFYAAHGGLYNQKYNGKQGVCWNLITSYKNGFRLKHAQHHYSSGAPTIISTKGNHDLLVLAYLNSTVATALLNIYNPTLNTTVGDVLRLPITLEREDIIIGIAQNNTTLSQEDWDSFETSWDFQRHPLLQYPTLTPQRVAQEEANGFLTMNGIADAYRHWEQTAEERFTQLKANEEELNRIFIDIYGLQDELTPEVEDKDVTVRKANLGRDIRSFISYAVGCMFGRYSLDVDGLAYAGGDWDAVYRRDHLVDEHGNVITFGGMKLAVSKDYTQVNVGGQWVDCTFPVDADNIIPICDDDYFTDDIVGRFIKFVETVYGKETLEENLRFIADALGGKGQPKEVIRNYFLNDFYTDHLKIYQKRPIYWLFDSGKKNGFKALIYMHRYQPDTIARMRTDYVHEQQSRYRTAIADLEQRIAAASTSERVKLSKKLKTLQDQAAEIQGYEEKIHHLADQYIAIDLDDGVKVNYAKFQDVLAKIK